MIVWTLNLDSSSIDTFSKYFRPVDDSAIFTF